MNSVNIFISHSGEMGDEIARELRDFLINMPDSIFRVTIAPRSIGTGYNWFREITRSLDEAHICIAIVDRNFKESSWCSYEIGYFSSTMEKPSVKRMYPLELPIIDFNSRLRARSHPLAQIQTLDFNKDAIRKFYNASLDIAEVVNPDTNLRNDNNYINTEWDKFERNINKIMNKYLGQNDDIAFDKSLAISAERADYLKDDLIDNIKYKLSECVGEGFKRLNNNQLSKVFISFPLRLLNHLNLTLQEAVGGTISITDQNFFETMWTDEIIDNVQGKIWATNVKGSNARKLENLDAQLETVNRLKSKDVSSDFFTRIFIIDPNKETQSELEELKQVLCEQQKHGITVGCILESNFKEFKEDLIASVGGVDFMVLDDKYVYVTNTNTIKRSILSVKLLKNAQVPKAVRISKKITKSPKTKFYQGGNINQFFEDFLNNSKKINKQTV